MSFYKTSMSREELLRLLRPETNPVQPEARSESQAPAPPTNGGGDRAVPDTGESKPQARPAF
jgi:hypothetical protein